MSTLPIPEGTSAMSVAGKKRKRGCEHPYLTGNFAPVQKTHTLTRCSYSGQIPDELAGGQYVRNGGNTMMNEELGQDYHWFDGDGMLAGVAFEQADDGGIVPKFVNQYILTDLYLAATSSPSIRSHIVPSIATMVNPAASFVRICLTVMRTLFLVLLSYLPGSAHRIQRISVTNTGFYYHDGRALATCESGPPMRVQLPNLETVGWYDGLRAEGEKEATQQGAGFGGPGLLGWMGEWTTGHPKVDPKTGDLLLFHNTFMAPYVKYSVVPAESASHEKRDAASRQRLMNIPVPGVSGPRMMHDFGVSSQHTVIMDLPLTLDPMNMMRGKPVVAYNASEPSRFGVFARHDPTTVRWFETSSCCIFHTANTWDEVDEDDKTVAVNFLACRLTSPASILVAGNIDPPISWREPYSDTPKQRPSFFESYDHDGGVIAMKDDDISNYLPAHVAEDAFDHASKLESDIAIYEDVPDEEQCRLYYYRFSLEHKDSNNITDQFALSTIPFEFPTVHPGKDMSACRYIYGCSTSTSSFNVALGKSVRIDVIVKADALALIDHASRSPHLGSTNCVDMRNIPQIIRDNEKNDEDTITCYKLPEGWYAQEARFVPRANAKSEDDGFLLFYAFDESQLDDEGSATDSAASELWVLDAKNMRDVVCRVRLPQRVPYGFHGSWFTPEQIQRQREVAQFRSLPEAKRGVGKAVYDRLTALVG